MKAIRRLYLTADKSILVAEGDPRAATLYAGIGDEIPDSAAARFGLVDGDLSGEVPAPVTDPAAQAILRAATMGVFGPVEIAGLTFSNEFRLFAKGEIDVAQLLALVTEPRLVVEALQFVDDEAKHWGPIPGGAEFVRQLEMLVTAARSIGADMPRLGEEISDAIADAVNAAEEARKSAEAANAGDAAPEPVANEETIVKEAAAPAETKEKAPAENKEEKRGANKAAKPAQAKG